MPAAIEASDDHGAENGHVRQTEGDAFFSQRRHEQLATAFGERKPVQTAPTVRPDERV